MTPAQWIATLVVGSFGAFVGLSLIGRLIERIGEMG